MMISLMDYHLLLNDKYTAMELLNALQIDCLIYLNRYGFLTVSQFKILTGKSSAGYIREMLGRLKRQGYVRSFRIEVSYQVRSENMYVNTPLAVELLSSHKLVDTDDLKPTTTPAISRDFFHRFNTNHVNLALDRFFESKQIPVRLMLSYFDKQGIAKKGTLVARTRIPLDQKGLTGYIPDSVFKTDTGLYLIEMYCDKDRKRIIHSISQHAKGLALGTPAEAFHMPGINPFVLCVFQYPGIYQAVKKALLGNEGFTAISHLFFFATLDDVKAHVDTAFTTIYDTPLALT